MDVHPMFAPRPSRGRKLAGTILVVVLALVVIIAGVKLFGGKEDASSASAPQPPSASPAPVEQPLAPVCGNDVIDQGEECDGSNFAGRSCEAEGYPGGQPTCTNCRVYFNACAARECVPEWRCDAWGSCPADGVQRRMCSDVNACGSVKGKPIDETSCYPETATTGPSAPQPPAVSFAKGDETVMLVFRSKDDATARVWVNGVEKYQKTCQEILNASGVTVEQVATREENTLPVVYCFARIDSRQELCARWVAPDTITQCSYDSKRDDAGNTRSGPYGSEGFSDALATSEWRVHYLADTVDLRFKGVTVYSLPNRQFFWRYVPTNNDHWYGVWEFERDGRIFKQVASDLFAPVTFLEQSAESYQFGGWPIGAGSYALTRGEPVAKSSG